MAGDPTANTAASVGTTDSSVVESQAQMNDTVTKVRAFSVAVESGKVSMDPAAGAALKRSLADHATQATQWLQRANALTPAVPMGRNPVGMAMASKFAARAQGGSISLISVLQQYVAALQEAQDALGTAIARYEQTDHEAATNLAAISKDLR